MTNASEFENRETAGTGFPPPLTMMAVILAGFALERFVPFRLPLPKAVATTAGAILLAVGLAVGVFAARALFRGGSHPNPHRPSQGLVTSGIYARTRNPIYISMALLILGFGILARNGWHLIGLALFLLIVDRTQIPREEKYLDARFGEAFRDYKRRVRRWV